MRLGQIIQIIRKPKVVDRMSRAEKYKDINRWLDAALKNAPEKEKVPAGYGVKVK